MNPSYFMCTDEICIRDLSHEELKSEIVSFYKSHSIADALEIADVLNVDVFEVNLIVSELINEGVLEEIG